MSELYLVRHGQASFWDDDYDRLSATGHEQSSLLGASLRERGIRFDAFITGNMRRHQQTLDGIRVALGADDTAPLHRHPGLDEYDFHALIGAYRERHPGQPLVEALERDPTSKTTYYRLLHHVLGLWSEGRIDGAPEPWEAFRQRVSEARALVHGLAAKGNRILAVTSGGPISTFIGTVLDIAPARVFELNMQIFNTSVSRFYFNHKKISLASFNAIPHLDQPERAGLVTYG